MNTKTKKAETIERPDFEKMEVTGGTTPVPLLVNEDIHEEKNGLNRQLIEKGNTDKNDRWNREHVIVVALQFGVRVINAIRTGRITKKQFEEFIK